MLNEKIGQERLAQVGETLMPEDCSVCWPLDTWQPTGCQKVPHYLQGANWLLAGMVTAFLGVFI